MVSGHNSCSKIWADRIFHHRKHLDHLLSSIKGYRLSHSKRNGHCVLDLHCFYLEGTEVPFAPIESFKTESTHLTLRWKANMTLPCVHKTGRFGDTDEQCLHATSYNYSTRPAPVPDPREPKIKLPWLAVALTLMRKSHLWATQIQSLYMAQPVILPDNWLLFLCKCVCAHILKENPLVSLSLVNFWNARLLNSVIPSGQVLGKLVEKPPGEWSQLIC